MCYYRSLSWSVHSCQLPEPSLRSEHLPFPTTYNNFLQLTTDCKSKSRNSQKLLKFREMRHLIFAVISLCPKPPYNFLRSPNFSPSQAGRCRFVVCLCVETCHYSMATPPQSVSCTPMLLGAQQKQNKIRCLKGKAKK